MSTQNFIGGSSPDVTSSWTGYGYVESTSAANGIALPTTGNLAYNGNKPIYVTTVRTFMAGRGGSRSMRVGIGGQFSAYKTVASAGSAAGSVDFTLNKVFSNGGNQTVKYDENGTGGFYFGRDTSVGDCTDGVTNFGGSLSGYATYYEVPTAPLSPSAVQDGVNNAVDLSWSAPSDNGGTAVTGYRIHYSTSSSFTSYTTVNTGTTATSYTITGLNYGQTYYFRVMAMNAAATAASTSSVASSTVSTYILFPDLDGWENFGGNPTGTTALIERTNIPAVSDTGLHRKVTATATGGSFTAGNYGIQRVLTNLEIGRVYTISGKAILGTASIQGNIYRFAMNGTVGSTVTLTSTTTGATVPSMSFTATATSHTIQFELAEAYTVAATGTIEDVYLYDLLVTRVATDLTTTKGYWIQDNLYEASLAEHYDLTMRSIGGYWWVDNENKTQFTQDLSYITPVGTFTDGQEFVGGVLTPGQSLPGEMHYQTINVGYDTSSVVNDITITNEGLTPYGGNDELPSSWQAVWNQTDSASQAAWGTRRTELSTNLWLSSIDNYVTNPSVEINGEGLLAGNTTINSFRRADLRVAGVTPSPLVRGRKGILMKVLTAATTHTGYVNYVDASDNIEVVAGQQYTMVIHGARQLANTDAQIQARLRWYDDAGTFISESVGTAVTLTTNLVWYKATVTATAPTGAVYGVPRALLQRSGGGSTTIGHKVWWDGCAVFDGTTNVYFDGDFPDTTSYIYDWLGDRQQSVSRRSTNRLYTRATDILTDFADPSVVVKSFTWNAVEDSVVAASIDVGSLIYLKFNGVEELYRVTGLSHEATPYEWFMTVNVQRAG